MTRSGFASPRTDGMLGLGSGLTLNLSETAFGRTQWSQLKVGLREGRARAEGRQAMSKWGCRTGGNPGRGQLVREPGRRGSNSRVPSKRVAMVSRKVF